MSSYISVNMLVWKLSLRCVQLWHGRKKTGCRTQSLVVIYSAAVVVKQKIQ